MADTPEPEKRPQNLDQETAIPAVIAALTIAASILLTTLILTGTLERIAERSWENALGISGLLTGLALIATGGMMTAAAIITLAKRAKGERRLESGPLAGLIAGTPIIGGRDNAGASNRIPAAERRLASALADPPLNRDLTPTERF